MNTNVLIAIIMFVIVVLGMFAYRVNQAYQTLGNVVTFIAALILFLMAIGVIHL